MGAWHAHNVEAVEREVGLMKGVAVKAPRQLARICLIIHCLANPSAAVEKIDAATLEAAIELVEYHRAHARKALGSLGAAPRDVTSLRERVVEALKTTVSSVNSVSSGTGARGTNLRNLLLLTNG